MDFIISKNKPKAARKASKYAKYGAIFFVLAAVIYPFISPHTNNSSAPVEVTIERPAQSSNKLSQARTQELTPTQNKWLTLVTKKGDSLSSIFYRLGLSANVLPALLSDPEYKNALHRLKAKQKLRFLISEDKQLERFIMTLDAEHELVFNRQGQQYTGHIQAKPLEKQLRYLSATINNSLYLTGKKQHISPKILRQLARIFYWKIDFSRDIRKGDHFTLIYEAYFSKGKLVRTGDIVAANFTNKGKEYKAIRYQDTQGNINYYDLNGKNLRRAFKRYPVKYTHVSSTFRGSRKHPILGITRPHKGIDLAAPTGTVIRAVANGKIQFIGRNGGYGNMIKVKHNKKYSTLYAHMLRFRRGIRKGARVKQGQVIGYVGQTGLADGPHCHFEFHTYGRAINPATVRLPNASPVPKSQRAQFAAKAKTLSSRLALYQEATTATA